jgi:hypothetical protein
MRAIWASFDANRRKGIIEKFQNFRGAYVIFPMFSSGLLAGTNSNNPSSHQVTKPWARHQSACTTLNHACLGVSHVEIWVIKIVLLVA